MPATYDEPKKEEKGTYAPVRTVQLEGKEGEFDGIIRKIKICYRVSCLKASLPSGPQKVHVTVVLDSLWIVPQQTTRSLQLRQELRHRVFIRMSSSSSSSSYSRSVHSCHRQALLSSPIASIKFVTLLRQHDPRYSPCIRYSVLDDTISRKWSPKSVCVAEDRHGHGHVHGHGP